MEKLKKILNEGQKRNKQSLAEELQSEIPKQYSEEDSDWLKCNLQKHKSSHYRRKSQKQEHGQRSGDQWDVRHAGCMGCGEKQCQKLVERENVKQHNNTLKVVAVK